MAVEISMGQAAVLTVLLGAGFGIGYAAKSSGAAASEPAAVGEAAAPVSPRMRGAETPAGRAPAVAAVDLKSPHTLEELLAMPEDDLYGPLALWLADAEPEDFEACWAALSQRPKPDTSLFDMVFLQWTWKDPHGAIRAAADGQYSNIPWWAWTKTDADEALAHAMAYAPDRVGAVVRWIGQSDPERALRLLAENPDLDEVTVLDGIISGLTRDDPGAAAKLALESGQYYHSRPMEAWLREDPHGAWEWFLANRGSDRYGQLTGSTLIALEREHPEMLAELAASTPPGALRRKLEAAEFRTLAMADPEKALALARGTESERVALERFSQLALSLVRDDPGKAKELMAELLARYPDPAVPVVRIERPGARSNSGGAPAELSQTLHVLAATDPAGTMALVIPASGGGGDAIWNGTVGNLASSWAGRDVGGFAAWAIAMPQPDIRDRALGLVVNQLNGSKAFPESWAYASKATGPRRINLQVAILRQWHREDPEVAAAWFDRTPMAEKERQYLGRIFSEP